MCIDVEHVQKRCTRTNTTARTHYDFLFLNFRTRADARSFARSRVLVLRNIANRVKERTHNEIYGLHRWKEYSREQR